MRKQNPIKYILIMIALLAVLSGCGIIEERLADGTAVAAGKDAGSMFSGEDQQPVGEGGGTGEDELSAEEMAQALEQTAAAIFSLTPPPSPTATLVTEATLEDTPTPTATVEGAFTPTVPGYQFTALAQTLTSMVTTPGAVAETETPEPTGDNGGGTVAEASPTPSLTPVPVEENPCNAFRFVAHVTYPNGSIVQPETYFYKSWQVQNVGDCTWNSSYALVYYDGYQLGGISPLVFGGTVLVAPGQYVTLTVQLYTPPQPGTYYSYWLLRDSSGNLFGGGETGTEPLIVQVVVPGDTAPIYTDPVVTAPPFTPGP